MKKFFSLLSITILLFSCVSKNGSLTGNAYWMYNKYVGNKPDAGTEVFLFSSDTSKDPLQTTCDVQGNFSFNKIPVGDYILVAQSKATNASSPNQVDELLTYLYEPFIGLSKNDNSHLIDDFITAYYSSKKYDIEPSSNSLSVSELKQFKDSSTYYHSRADVLADSILTNIPENSPFEKWIYRSGLPKDKIVIQDVKLIGVAGKKLKVKKVKIDVDKSEVIVIDFGVTYF